MIGPLILRLFGAAILSAVLISTPAYACMSDGPDEFATGLIWRTKPADIPADAIALKIKFIKPTEEWGGFLGRVISGPKPMVNQTHRFKSEAGHSCVGLGRFEGFIIVRRKPVESNTDDRRKSVLYLSAVDYAPSFWDWLPSLLTGENWHYPGRLSELRFD